MDQRQVINFLWITTAVLATLIILNKPAFLPADDGFFYLQIAQKISDGAGSTFNSIHETNGYHPLWMIFCIPFAFLFSDANELLSVIIIFQSILFLVALKLFSSICRHRNFLSQSITFQPILGIYALLFIFISIGTLFLSEAHLNLLFLCALLYALNFLNDKEDLSVTDGIITGGIAGLYMLSRLDNFFVLGALGVSWVFTQNKLNIQFLISTFLSFSILIGSYLSYNFSHFHHLVPVSGAIKSTFPYPDWVFPGRYECLLLFLGILYLILIYFLPHVKSIVKKQLYLLKGLIIGGMIHVIYTHLFMRGAGIWYYVPAYLYVSFFLVEVQAIFISLLPKFSHFKILIFKSILLSTFTLLATYIRISSSYANEQDFSFYLSGIHSSADRKIGLNQKLAYLNTGPIIHYIQSHIPHHRKIWTYDSPGIIAYYTDVAVIPTDGLVNNYTYTEELIDLGIKKYAEHYTISYLLAPLPPRSGFIYNRLSLVMRLDHTTYHIQLIGPLSGQRTEPIQLKASDIIHTFKNPYPKYQTDYDSIALWRLP